MNPRPSNMPIFALFMLVILFGMVISRATKAEGGGPDRSLSPPFRHIHACREQGCILAQATPRYYDEQLLNYRITEFCAKTTNPPLKPLGEWLDAFTTERRRKCGDA